MMFVSKLFPCLLLAIIVPSASETLEEKFAAFLEVLENIKSEVSNISNVLADQCPCFEDVVLNGTETIQDVECFQTKIAVFRNGFNALLASAKSLNATTGCPLGGAVFINLCNSTSDESGGSQNNTQESTTIVDYTFGPFNENSYELDYFGNDPFVVRCRIVPGGPDVRLGGATDAPLTASAVGTGIVYLEPTNEVYVAITFDDTSLNGVYAFNRTGFPDIRLVFPYDGPTGQLYLSGDFLYMVDGPKIFRIADGDSSWTLVITWLLVPIGFAVQDDGTMAFCESSGALWLFNPGTFFFRQVKQPNPVSCASLELHNGLIYVASEGSSMVEVFNSSAVGTDDVMPFNLNTSTTCPLLVIDPRF
ncbi:uncharacterized protein LOC124110405 [Haliotis rufescens]|uniref:uncharacterized protein LOC124110405 n=1 Tax=Haliotis rufescens TaxID=6454 RepID=UPI00201F3005|nr:uncharacterized protein LOC124110405 [Haliotis rufescens]